MLQVLDMSVMLSAATLNPKDPVLENQYLVNGSFFLHEIISAELNLAVLAVSFLSSCSELFSLKRRLNPETLRVPDVKGASCCCYLCHRGGSSLEEVVEKQADLIEYLKQHNTLLSKRLLNLTAQH